ncbi:tetratricopeptide repeat protein [Thalassotalea ganghwensis]
MFLNDDIAPPKGSWLSSTRTSVTVTVSIGALIVIALLVVLYMDYSKEQKHTQTVIASPKINDILFVDYRQIDSNLRPNQRYRLAKIVDITGDIISLQYSSPLYKHAKAPIKSIKLGQLTHESYFESKRYNIPFSKLEEMYNQDIIYLAKRPLANTLYGNLVSPRVTEQNHNYYIYGKKENLQGIAYLEDGNTPENLEKAFDMFKQAADLGYAEGQVNLAQMYINGQHVEKNLDKALDYLKVAAVQSHKNAILKYEIVCQQVDYCELNGFYQELVDAGVNIEVRELAENPSRIAGTD